LPTWSTTPAEGQ